MFSGTCVTSFPDDYYQTFSGEAGVYQVPICSLKLILKFDLSLTTQARIININFNYGIVNMIMAMSQKIQIEIGNTQIGRRSFCILSTYRIQNTVWVLRRSIFSAKLSSQGYNRSEDR